MSKQPGCVKHNGHDGECYVGTKTRDCDDAQKDAEIATLRAKVEALEPSDDVIELVRVAIDPDEPRLSGSCRAMVEVWLQRVSAARKGGSDADGR